MKKNEDEKKQLFIETFRKDRVKEKHKKAQFCWSTFEHKFISK